MISIIIPFYNEAESLPILVNYLTKSLRAAEYEWEIILVNDGSTDIEISRLRQDYGGQANLHIISHHKRLGKGKALQTGIENSRGEILAFMDGDFQDDPKDLPKFIEKINQGYDFVNGKRVNRQDSRLVKLYSKLAAWFLETFLHSPFEDINCPYKMFKRQVLNEFVLYGNNFRFFPLAVFYNGYKVTEIPVVNHRRKFGRSKFGPGKLVGGAFDTLTAFFIYQFSEKPLHFFGPIGLVMFFIGFVISLYLAIERLFFNVLLYRRPMLFLGLLLIIIGVQIVMTGIIGELIVFLHKKKN